MFRKYIPRSNTLEGKEVMKVLKWRITRGINDIGVFKDEVHVRST